MEDFFVDFNKRKFNRVGYPVFAVLLAGDGIFQLSSVTGRLRPTVPVLEFAYALVLVLFWLFPPKWYFKVDESAIEYKRQFAGPNRFDWTGIKKIELLKNKVAISFADGGSHRIALSFLGEKERQGIKDAISRFATAKNLLSAD